jgi:TonB family protein
MNGDNQQKTMTNSQPRLRIAGLLLMASFVLADDEVTVQPKLADAGNRVPLQTVVPQYPEKARRARVEGEVEVCFNVDREGRTNRVSVRRSTNRAFEKPSRDAIKQSTYKPLPKGKELSGIKTCRTFRFYLNPVAIETPEN